MKIGMRENIDNVKEAHFQVDEVWSAACTLERL